MTKLPVDLIRCWAEELSAASSDATIRDLEADFHRSISGNVVRKARLVRSRVIENDLPPEASGIYKLVEEWNSAYDEDWVEERTQFDTSCFDDDDRLVSVFLAAGYETADGDFVLKPDLVVVPRYIFDAEKAFIFKGYLCGGALRACIIEVEGDLMTEFLVTLSDCEGHDVGTSRHYLLGAAVVGATLDALTHGWRRPVAMGIEDDQLGIVP